ncbi:MAG: hypothetical protein KKI08_13500 [Armatimonadetes bacterium]|nr:hypothetical protein [Armatimonadota bacterium]
MPKKAKRAPKKPAPKKLASKTELVLAQPTSMPTEQVVAKAKEAGITITRQRVAAIRWAARQNAKKTKKEPTAKATLMPKPAAAAKMKHGKPATKSEYVLGFPLGTSAADIVAAGEAAKIKLSVAHVYAIRTAARAKAKQGKAASTGAKAVRTKAKKAPGVVGRISPDRGAASTAIARIDPLDLAYAIGRLIEAAKTTTAEVVKLAAEREARISSLETELAALKAGNLPVIQPAKVARPVQARKPSVKVAKPAVQATSQKARPKASQK